MPYLSAILVLFGLLAGWYGFIEPSATGLGLCLVLLILAGALMDSRWSGRGAHRLD